MQILKLGGSVLTKKNGYAEEDEDSIDKLTGIIAKMWDKLQKKLVLVHGAGSFGHPFVLRYDIKSGIRTRKQMVGYADTHMSCSHLSNVIVGSLVGRDVPAVSIPPALIAKQKDRRITKIDDKIIFEYMKRGYLPVLYGDMVLDDSIGGSVCSGDQLVAVLGKKAKKVIFGSDVDGVLVRGRVVPKITRSNFKEIEGHLKASRTVDVTGGMEGKINEILKMKTPSYIVNAKKPERIEDLLLGKRTLCTEIRP